MHKFGIVSLVKGLIFTYRFDGWVYKTQSEQDYMWFEDHWDEFWDGYGELCTNLSEIVEFETEKEAFRCWANMDICRTYYFWMKERHGSKSDLVADCLYLLWMIPQEA